MVKKSKVKCAMTHIIRTFRTKKGLKYTIYCYCYDYKGLVDNPENFEFCFEVQLNTGRGIIGVEAIQWDFGTNPKSLINIEFFEKKIDEIWEKFDSLNFPE